MDVVKIAGAGLFAAAGLAFACPSLAQDSAAVQAARPADSAVPPAPPSPATPPSPPAQAMPASPGSPERAETPVRLQFEIRDPDHPGAMKTVKIVLSKEDAARAGAALKRVMIEHHAQDEALRDVQPKIDAAMAAVAKARPEIEKALADVQPQIDAALAKLRDDLARAHMNVKIEQHETARDGHHEIRIEAETDDKSGDK